MNRFVQTVDPEKVLFFDIEVVRKSKELEKGSREYELYKKKITDKDTDETPTDEEVVENYNRRAALRMTYTKVVSIGVAFIKNNQVHMKAIDEGSEEDIIMAFCKIAGSFDYLCGANIIAYDLPVLMINGSKYFNMVDHMPDRFITSGKKPWEMKNIIDLMDVFKGTHYSNSSLDEICAHFDLPSSKTDLDGSMVSNEYWTNGVAKISEYVKADVLANINIFSRMRYEPIYGEYTDKSGAKEPELPLLEKLYKNNYLSDDIQKEIQTLTSSKKITTKDKKNLQLILEGVYISKEFMNEDDPATVERKENEIKEFIKTL